MRRILAHVDNCSLQSCSHKHKTSVQILCQTLMLAGVDLSHTAVFSFHSIVCQLLKEMVGKSLASGAASKFLVGRSIVIPILSDALVSHPFMGIQLRGNLHYQCQDLSIYTGWFCKISNNK